MSSSDKMNNYVGQYKILFCLSWLLLYVVFPAWRFPHNRGDQFMLNVFLVYFTASAYLMDRYFSFLFVDKPAFMKINDLSTRIKENAWLFILCFISLLLHMYFAYFTSIIVMGEVIFLRTTFWIHDFLNMHWHRLFPFPVQYFFWSLTVSILLMLKQKKAINIISGLIDSCSSFFKSNKLTGLLVIGVLFNVYVYIFPGYSLQESVDVLRYPPVSRVIYLIVYSAFGVSETGPRIVQFVFYISGSVYLYRTILLFNKKEAALLGATIYLFSPIVFFHATLASTGSGVAFFIILISYYFLRFIKEENNRDLLLCTYFIGLGFLYKEEIVVMFIICFVYLLISKIRSRNWSSLLHFKILLLSLIPVLPWLKIGPGNYAPVWNNLISFDGLTLFSQMLKHQLSPIVFALFMITIIYILITKKDSLSLYFLFFFVTYYLFFTLKGTETHRYSVALYPAIHVLLAQFICGITQRIRWKDSFRLVYTALTIYLAVICVLPRSSSNPASYNYNDFENQRYPIETAMDWIHDMTGRGDRILALYFYSDIRFYVDRIYKHRDEISDRIIFSSSDYKEMNATMERLKQYCTAEKISYIMFPYSPHIAYLKSDTLKGRVKKMNELKENMDTDFTKVVEFGLDDNYILVYKPKGIMPD